MLPREIQTEHLPDRTRFDLPRRPLGALHWIGVVPMGFAVSFAWMPGGHLLRQLGELLRGGGSPIGWFFVLFLVLFVGAALIPFALGLFILAGRTRVVVRRHRLVSTELAGPFRWSRRTPLNQIERLEFAAAKSGQPMQTPAWLLGISGIAAVQKDGKKFPVAIGYPREWIEPLLAELAGALKQHGAEVPVTEAPLRMETTTPATTETRAEKPAGSNIELTDSGWSVELQVPSRGLWKESYGMLSFGIFWCLIVGVISGAFLFGKGAEGSRLGVAGFLGLFWLVGLGMVLAGAQLGTRRWVLRADRSRLEVTRHSVLRTRQWTWSARDIEDLSVGDSGTKINERTLEQLQVMARAGRRKTGLLTGRSREELAWVATVLRLALGVRTAEAQEPAPPRIGSARTPA